MKLQLLDIEKIIQKNNYREVKNARLLGKGFDPESLWSVEIFGNLGSRDRKNRFGYIQLNTELIHPVVFNMLKVSSESISKIVDKKANFIVSDKQYIEDVNGETGLAFLIRTLKDISIIKTCKKEKKDSAAFLEKNKNLILINKFLVIPAGYRDLDITKRDAMQVTSEVNNYYKDVMYINSQLTGEESLDNILIEKLQLALNRVVNWMQSQLKGKKGLMRGSMLKKRMDYSSRLVVSTSQEIPLGHIGIPFHTALAIYEPLFTHYVYKKDPAILEDIKNFLQKPDLDFNTFLKFINDFTVHPQILPEDLKVKLEHIANQIIKGQTILFKRDPVNRRNNWSASTPIITEGRVCVVNALEIQPLEGDFDGDTLEILPLFSKEAQAEAKEKMHPLYSKSKWQDTLNNNTIIYGFIHDALATIYRATKE